MSKFPAATPYDEITLDLAALKVPFRVGGLFNYVAILASTDATDMQEVSFNDGQSWARLRKGLFVPIGLNQETGTYDGTVGLAFRNPTGAGVTLSVAVGFGSFVDGRLVIDSTLGAVPVSSAQLPAVLDASGGLKVAEVYQLPSPGTAGYGRVVSGSVAAANATTTVVAAGANVNGIRVIRGAYFMWLGASGQAHLFVDNGVQTLTVAGGATNDNTRAMNDRILTDIIIPAGLNLKYTIEGQYSLDFSYIVL